MPWSETCPMEERAKFVLEALEGWTSMTELCGRYGISRRVGYKWLHRYEERGLGGLADRSRAPRRQAAATAPEIVGEIVALRSKHPTWGPRKLRAWLDREKPERSWPACSTIGAILKREGLTRPRRRRPAAPRAWRPPRTEADAPNRVWTTDFKGQFRLGSGRIVLSAHDPGRPQPLPAGLSGSARHRECRGASDLRARVRGVWTARGDPHRQRGPVQQSPGAGRTLEAGGVVDPAGHPAGAHPEKPPGGQRGARTHAPYAEGGSDAADAEDGRAPAARLQPVPADLQRGTSRTKRWTCSRRRAYTSLRTGACPSGSSP